MQLLKSELQARSKVNCLILVEIPINFAIRKLLDQMARRKISKSGLGIGTSDPSSPGQGQIKQLELEVQACLNLNFNAIKNEFTKLRIIFKKKIQKLFKMKKTTYFLLHFLIKSNF